MYIMREFVRFQVLMIKRRRNEVGRVSCAPSIFYLRGQDSLKFSKDQFFLLFVLNSSLMS